MQVLARPWSRVWVVFVVLSFTHTFTQCHVTDDVIISLVTGVNLTCVKKDVDKV